MITLMVYALQTNALAECCSEKDSIKDGRCSAIILSEYCFREEDPELANCNRFDSQFNACPE